MTLKRVIAKWLHFLNMGLLIWVEASSWKGLYCSINAVPSGAAASVNMKCFRSFLELRSVARETGGRNAEHALRGSPVDLINYVDSHVLWRNVLSKDLNLKSHKT